MDRFHLFHLQSLTSEVTFLFVGLLSKVIRFFSLNFKLDNTFVSRHCLKISHWDGHSKPCRINTRAIKKWCHIEGKAWTFDPRVRKSSGSVFAVEGISLAFLGPLVLLDRINTSCSEWPLSFVQTFRSYFFLLLDRNALGWNLCEQALTSTVTRYQIKSSFLDCLDLLLEFSLPPSSNHQMRKNPSEEYCHIPP